MFLLPGYQVKEKIYESNATFVVRASREKDNQSVILKILHKELPTAKDLVRYRQEYEICKRLEVAGSIQVYALELTQDAQILVFEDIGAQSLRMLAGQQPFNIEHVLALGVKIAECLGEIHAVNIIHKDINPNNIIYNPDTEQLKIIDFGISTVLPRENPTLTGVTCLEGTLAYIAPEQTGRMNRVMDYRTDFYGFGVTLYELLTGRRPFITKDDMELVHCHIAKIPTSPHELDAHIPPMVSKIVMKLMAKMAEDRYQSALGIKRDLQTCLEELKTGGRDEFTLGQEDLWDKFHLPQKLYGRSEEIATLLQTFEIVADGGNELIMVAGYSGIGKTALIASCHKPITERQGYFVSGKFDQFQRNIPYSAVVSAFRDLIQQLITESEIRIAHWKRKLQAALGSNGQVMVDVIPEIELIIDPQPPIEMLGPTETQNRFNLVFQNFIRTFCQPEHPLTIFLDDLQWADSASLNLISLMMTQSSTLLLIGAYRDNEVSPAHPLMMTLGELEKNGREVTTITLEPLPFSEVTQYISDAVNADRTHVASLAELVYGKTQGNPFFMGEFMKSLDTESLLTFDQQQETWVWDIQRIQARDITDNVVELMASKLKQLDQASQAALKLGACIGNRFNVKTLSIILEKTPHATAWDLMDAMRQGLIIPIGEDYKLVTLDIETPANPTNAVYKFAHDRIQQAAYSLIPDNQKQQAHRRIGYLLLTSATSAQLENDIFMIVDQLNVAADTVTDPIAQLQLARLNLTAGIKAKHSAAYQPAFNYLKIGIDIMPDGAWNKQDTRYRLMLSLHHEITAAAYLCGTFDQMDRYFNTVLQHAHALLDQVKVYEIKSQALMSEQKQLEAVQNALKVLKLLGVDFPLRPNQLSIVQGLFTTKFMLHGRPVQTLLDLHKMTDPQHLAVMRILASIWSAAYQAVPQLMPLIVVKMVQYTLRHGNAHESVLAYAWYGLLLCGVTHDIHTGYQFGQTALKLLEKFHVRQLKARLFFVVNCFVTHWRDPVQETLQPSLEAYRVGLDTGALEFSAYAGVVCCYHGLIVGKELGALEVDMQFFSDGVRHIKQEISLNYIEIFRQTVMNLRGKANDPTILVGDACDETHLLPIMLEANDRTGIFFIYLNKLILKYIFGQYTEAYKYTQKLAAYLDGVTALLVVSIYHFFDSLARLAVYAECAKTEKQKILNKVKKNQKKMERWAFFAPNNNAHKYQLVEAELARVTGNVSTAGAHYNEAIRLAEKHHYTNDAALALELAANYHQKRDHLRAWQHHLRDAHMLYTQWGAVAKTRQLERYLPHRTNKMDSFQVDGHIGSTTEGTLDALDLTSVIKASQAISGEFLLDRLIEKLLTIVLQTAGATKSAFFLDRDSVWTLEAISTGDSMERPSIRVDQLDPIIYPKEMVQYVTRTQKILVLNDSADQTMFADSIYLKDKGRLSLICMPIIYQGRITGILFLENYLVTNAFTLERLTTIEILASQIAISIENALYYEKMEQARRAEQAKQVAEAANKAKGEFLAHMSHELRTPLNGILGYAQILLRDNALNKDQKHRITVMKQSGEHLLTLINDILDLSKIDAGKIELFVGDINLSAFIAQITDLFSMRADQKGLSFVSKRLTALPAGICADEKRLRQIIINLLNNAVKYTEKGSVTWTIAYQDSHLRMAVIDTGYGISPEDLPRIFDAFQQVGDQQQAIEGTGLGLPITKKLVDLMQGKLRVISELNKGSSFEVDLLFPQGTVPNNEPTTAYTELTNYIGARKTVLVVDDKQSNRDILVDLLQPIGFEIFQAANGQEAIDQFHRYQPDLLLLDLIMPVVDGYSAARTIRAQDNGQAIKIIAISASVLEMHQQLGFEAGCDAFLPKPIEADALFHAIGEHLQLEWVTNDQAEQTTSDVNQEMIAPPQAAIEELTHFIMSGDISGIIDFCEALIQQDARFKPFAQNIIQLAKSFQEKKLQMFIEEYRHKG